MHGKYIVIEIDGEEIPLVFPDFPCPVTHKQIARLLHVTPISGAYCCLETWAAFGEAISLNLKTRGPVDTALLFRRFSGANAATLSALQSMLERPRKYHR